MTSIRQNNLLRFVLIAVGLCTATDVAHAERGAQSVRYELRLAAGEYAIVHSSVTTGVIKYGGDARYSLRAVRSEHQPSELQWIMTIEDARLMDALSVWAAETTTTLLASVDLNSLDSSSRDALRAMQSVNAKLAQSRANPTWEEQTVSAAVATLNGTVGLRIGSEFLKATGAGSGSLQTYLGSRVIARGFTKIPGEFEVSSVTPRKDNTLEVVLMSECPFGMRAADAVLRLVGSRTSELVAQPKIEMRYLFYKRNDAKSAAESWWCLHGESELRENVVQIVIRDTFPAKYAAYMLARRADLHADWRVIAAVAGLTPEELSAVDAAATTDRDALIAAEFEYVSKTLRVTDGSPSFFWESERVTDLTSVRAFEAIDLVSSGSCGSSPAATPPSRPPPSEPAVATP